MDQQKTISRRRAGGCLAIALAVLGAVVAAWAARPSPVSVEAGHASLIVASVEPAELAAASTVPVTVHGSGFQAGAQVAVRRGDGEPGPASTATVTRVTPTAIEVLVHTSAPGSFRPNVEDLVVTNPDGGVGVLRRAIAVSPVPIHYHAEPFTVAQGQTVAVEVTCGRCGSPAVRVAVEGAGVTATLTDREVPHQVTVTVAASAEPGPRAFVVVTADGGHHAVDPPLTVVASP